MGEPGGPPRWPPCGPRPCPAPSTSVRPAGGLRRQKWRQARAGEDRPRRGTARGRKQPGQQLSFGRAHAGAGRSGGTLRQYGDGRQHGAVQALEECTTAGRDIGDPVQQVRYFSSAASVSPPPATLKAFELGHRLGNPPRAPAELVDLEDANRTVPDDGSGARNQPRIKLGGARPDVEDQVVRAQPCSPAGWPPQPSATLTLRRPRRSAPGSTPGSPCLRGAGRRRCSALLVQ